MNNIIAGKLDILEKTAAELEEDEKSWDELNSVFLSLL